MAASKKPTVTVRHAMLLNALAKFGATYVVSAGKYDGDEENCKYCDEFATYDEALADLARVADYPWSRIDVRNAELSDLRMANVKERAARVVAGTKPIVTWFTKADGSAWRKERIGNNARIIPVARVGA